MRGGTLALALTATLWSGAAAAQDVPQVVSPLRVESDHNGVNVATGRMTIEGPVLSVPAAPNLRFDRVQNAAPYVVGSITGSGFNITGHYSLHIGASASEAFTCQWTTCDSATFTGSVYQIDTDGDGPVEREYRQAGTGARYFFTVRHYDIPGVGQPHKIQYYAGRVEYPNGETITYTYDLGGLTGDPYGRAYRRPSRIASNMGYHILLTYPVQYMSEGVNEWSTPNTVTLYRTTGDVPLRRFTYSGNTVTDSGSTVSDPADDRTYTCTSCGGTLGFDVEAPTGTLQLPGEATPAVQVTPGTWQNSPLIQTVTRDGVPWTYTYQNAHQQPGSLTWLYDSVTVTGPNGFNQVYHMQTLGSPPFGQFNVLNGITAVAGAGSPNPTTSYVLDAVSGRPTQVTYPEGNAVSVVYDDAGNVTERTIHARPGSGTLPATITERAHYTLPTWPQFCTTACWRPTWSRDGLQRQTDYIYNASGQLTEQSEPVDANGVRRRTFVEYTVSPAGISRRTRATVCAVTSAPGQGLATCNTSQSIVTEYEYVGDTPLGSLERQRDPVTSAELETRHSYDVHGRLTSTDGPLPGDGDTVHYRYDTFGRRTWEIGLPDGSGLRQATLSFYRASDDRVVRVETGNVTSTSATAFATHLNRTDLAYDARRNPVRETASTPTTAGTWEIQTLLQRSFDDRGQLVCEARRMDRTTFATLPDTNICVPTATGSAGPDRITQNVYNNLGLRTQHRVGVGSAVEAADATWEHNRNGQITAVIDGNGNRAELRYDGHMRQDRWTFPSPAGPPGTVNAADYEEYGYDAAGNRLSHRRRDGSTLTFQYDHLNRLVRKTVPERANLSATHTRDVFHGYDLRNQPLFARFDSAAGEGVTNAYDAFGRQVSSSINMGGVTRALTYTNDEAGRRRTITHPDNTMFELRFDSAARPVSIGENGASFGQGVVAAWGYDQHGRPLYMARPGIAPTFYAFDPLSRLTAIGHDLKDSGDDLGLDFAYNPASGLSSTTRSNDIYAWTRHSVVNRSYTADGLNRYSQVVSPQFGTTHYGYDANGNLASDGANTYVYDVENRLIVAYGERNVTFVYDPLGRIFQYSYLSGGNWIATTFLHDGDALVGEYNAAGALTERYVHGPAAGTDDPLVWYHGNTLTDRRWLHADHQGSIVAVSNGEGALVNVNAYDEYGFPALNNTGRFQYTGQIYLAELGMYHYKARVYSPGLGRFLQTDPVGYDDQFNLYAYVGNDPVNMVDPTGKEGACFYTRSRCNNMGNPAVENFIRGVISYPRDIYVEIRHNIRLSGLAGLEAQNRALLVDRMADRALRWIVRNPNQAYETARNFVTNNRAFVAGRGTSVVGAGMALGPAAPVYGLMGLSGGGIRQLNRVAGAMEANGISTDSLSNRTVGTIYSGGAVGATFNFNAETGDITGTYRTRETGSRLTRTSTRTVCNVRTNCS